MKGVTFPRVLAAEWLKLRTLRSSLITLAIGFVGIIGFGAIASAANASHFDRMTPQEQLAFDPVGTALFGMFIAQLAIAVLGVLLASGEYSTGMIRSTFAAVPRRLPVVWAKMLVFAATTWVLMTIAAFISFFLGERILGVHGTNLSAPHAVRSVLGVGLYLTVIAVLGIAFGFVLRSTAGGISSLLALLLVIPGLSNLLPSSWQRNIQPYLPDHAGGGLVFHDVGPGSLGPWSGFAVMCLWGAAALTLALVLVRRRDA